MPYFMSDFETAVAALDLSLFEKIESQSTDDDKRSLLACQLATRVLRPGYNYLEIGSYLGGSIQPHLIDPLCARIFSIDKRPEKQPDARGVDYSYLNNSTGRMMQRLAEVAPTEKVTTIDGSARDLKPTIVDASIDLCFIDGEHTDDAVFSDFKFCLATLNRSGAILFHDASVTYNGIDRCLKYLNEMERPFRGYSLPNEVFVIEVGAFPLHRHEKIMDRLTDNYGSFIYCLQANDYYRQFANKAPFRLYRRLMAKWKGLNRFE
jgi:predicted O-methyltransferase YrrM